MKYKLIFGILYLAIMTWVFSITDNVVGFDRYSIWFLGLFVGFLLRYGVINEKQNGTD